MTSSTTCGNSQRKLNPRHSKLPSDLKEAIIANKPVGYDFYLKHKDVYSSAAMKVVFECRECGLTHVSDFKHLNRRTVVSDPICPKCVMKVATKDEVWRKHNSEAQLRIQSLPEQRAKNAAGVAKFWAENPEKLKKMRENLMVAQQRKDVKEKYAARQTWNGGGISGDYLSRWGWLLFDSSYELATIVAMEEMETVKTVRRGPTISYQFEGVERQYFMDFEVEFVDGTKWWVEVKSGYVGKNVDRLDKLRAKLATALDLARQGYTDKIVLLTEKNALDVIGRKMPRSSNRKALLKNLYDRIIFARESDEEKYK